MNITKYGHQVSFWRALIEINAYLCFLEKQMFKLQQYKYNSILCKISFLLIPHTSILEEVLKIICYLILNLGHKDMRSKI